MIESQDKLMKDLERMAGKGPRRWLEVSHYGFGYTACPYCGDETGWYNPWSNRFQSDYENNKREHCPKCGERVYASERWIMNQPE